MMSEEIYRGYTIKIYQDDMPPNPREWDNLGKLCLFHNRYDFPNEGNLTPDEAREIIAGDNDHAIALPVKMYDHSGISLTADPMRTISYPYNCSWDSGWAGVIFVYKADLRAEFGWKRITQSRFNQIMDILIAEVETYSQYLNGEAYGYVINNLDDSCWGFYDFDYCLEQAKEAIDYVVDKEAE